MLFWKDNVAYSPVLARKPLKVAMVTSFPADCSKPRGGVEAVSVNLARGLAKYTDLDLHVVTTDPNCKALSRTSHEGFWVHRLPWLEKKVLVHALGRGRRDLKEYLTALGPDVIHAHDFYGIMIKSMQFPRVVTIHGFIYADTLQAENGFPWLRSLFWRHFEFSSWSDHPHIVSISPYVRERLRNLTTGAIHDIDNPICEDFFNVEHKEIKGRIFCAAVFCQRKNILGLLEAFSRIIHAGVAAELRLAGSTHEPEYEQAVRQFISHHNLQNWVTLLGPINSEQIQRELAEASVFALTSFEEGAPLAVAEAMAVGVPVVASNCCGIPYMVQDGQTGFLVNPRDPDDIARKLHRVLKNDSLRLKMGQKAWALAREHYHPMLVAARTRDLYMEAVEEYERSCSCQS